MTKFFTTSAVIAVGFLTVSAAQANTVLLDYAGQDVKVTNDSQDYDFFSLFPFGPRMADGPTVRMAEENTGPFRPDGLTDMTVQSNEGMNDDRPAFGSISLREQSISPFFPIATIDGVVRFPSLFSIIFGCPPSMKATAEFVVPRSIPIIFDIIFFV